MMIRCHGNAYPLLCLVSSFSLLVSVNPARAQRVNADNLFGSALRGDSLGNAPLAPNTYGGQVGSYRFKPNITGEVVGFTYYNQVNGGGYSAGTGGNILYELRTDDGTNNHWPSTTVLASTLKVGAMSLGFYPKIAFGSPGHVEAGKIYHLVFTNQHSDPTNNFVSLNCMHNFAGLKSGVNMDVGISDEALAVLTKNTPGDTVWEHNTQRTPIFNIFYADGSAFGQGYYSAISGWDATITATDKVRQTFTVHGVSRTVSDVAIRVQRKSGDLNVRLEKKDGTLVEEGVISGSTWTPDASFQGYEMGWVKFTFQSLHVLEHGQGYNLVLSSANGSYLTYGLLKGTMYNWSSETDFFDGHAQYSQNSTSWQDYNYGGNSTEQVDLQFYFTVTSNGGPVPPPGPISGITNGSFENGMTGWTSSGDALWWPTWTAFYGNSHGAESGLLDHGQSTCIEQNVTMPDAAHAYRLSFYWRVSSEKNMDLLHFYVDGKQQQQISGEVEWQKVIYDLPAAASHKVKFCYVKDSWGNGGNDNGMVDEVTLSSCSATCDDSNVCTTDALTGDPAQCTASCTFTPITSCTNGDGCCPSGCGHALDDDCSASCGNNVVDPGETCDPPTSCPASCNDSNTCTTDTLSGAAAQCTSLCTYAPITACANGDSCCPAGCNQATDSDCSASCGDSVVDPGETCDPPSGCPTSCSDGDACTTDLFTGSADACSAACSYSPITACQASDGCCPAGCDRSSDSDCSASCGDSVIDASETCDPPSSCPVSCDDGNACTADTMSGSAANCNAACHHAPITTCASGDGCCPQSCTAAQDSDCASPSSDGGVKPNHDGSVSRDGATRATRDDGCNCTTASSDGATWWSTMLLFLAVMLWLRRRSLQ
jgi:MYXO-CTERM domain-containing protein